jgi:ferredoxin-thioredoxin reductase catalytic subunit/rubredoxin
LTTLDYVRQRAESDARSRGYRLNNDASFLNDLLEGLKKNEERYGYPSCPCRIATGKLDLDRDIICPCDYRDPDVADFGACYCALYIRGEIAAAGQEVQPVPERRPLDKQSAALAELLGTEVQPAAAPEPPPVEAPKAVSAGKEMVALATDMKRPETGGKLKLWYCKQCGYMVFREEPPYICPICKAKRELFAEISIEIVEKI